MGLFILSVDMGQYRRFLSCHFFGDKRLFILSCQLLVDNNDNNKGTITIYSLLSFVRVQYRIDFLIFPLFVDQSDLSFLVRCWWSIKICFILSLVRGQ